MPHWEQIQFECISGEKLPVLLIQSFCTTSEKLEVSGVACLKREVKKIKQVTSLCCYSVSMAQGQGQVANDRLTDMKTVKQKMCIGGRSSQPSSVAWIVASGPACWTEHFEWGETLLSVCPEDKCSKLGAELWCITALPGVLNIDILSCVFLSVSLLSLLAGILHCSKSLWDCTNLGMESSVLPPLDAGRSRIPLSLSTLILPWKQRNFSLLFLNVSNFCKLQ